MLNYTREFATHHHLIANVRLKGENNVWETFLYDHYPEHERLVVSTGEVYARRRWEHWKISSDYGETGNPVEPETAAKLDQYAGCGMAPLSRLSTSDMSQGEAVWTLLHHEILPDHDLLTYEKTRERRFSDREYPRYTFLRYHNDSQKALLLKGFEGNLKKEGQLRQLSIVYDYLFLIPGNYKIHFGKEVSGTATEMN